MHGRNIFTRAIKLLIYIKEILLRFIGCLNKGLRNQTCRLIVLFSLSLLQEYYHSLIVQYWSNHFKTEKKIISIFNSQNLLI